MSALTFTTQDGDSYRPIILLGSVAVLLTGAIYYFFGFTGGREDAGTPPLDATTPAAIETPSSPAAGIARTTRPAIPDAAPPSRGGARRGVPTAGRSPVNPGPLVPVGFLSINARPWADVWIDGHAVGTTPLGNLRVAVGRHEIVWRHPQLGERRQAIDVVADVPSRISVDYRN